MKNIKVNLLSSTSKSVLKTALEKSYSSEFKDSSFEKVANILINTMKHESVVEHVNYSFEILGISRLCLQEVVRSRIASYTVKSTRFTIQKMKDINLMRTYEEVKDDLEIYFCYPFGENTLTKAIVSTNMTFISEYNGVKDIFKNEELKYLLPENYRTDLVMTINARSLKNFLTLKLGNKNNNPHFEIKHLANLMLEEVLKTETGFLFKDLQKSIKTID